NTTFNGLSVGNLPPATYVANPTDANGCSSLLQYRVTIASLPCGYTLATSNTNVSCFGGSNGSVTLTVTGSVGAVTITWVNAANNSPVGSGATVNGLPAGTYNYNYQDNNQNFTGSVIVSQPGSAMGIHMVTTDVSCGGNANGQAVVSVDSGGVSPFTYTWNPAQPNNPVASNLGQGPISVVVTDANGCTATTSGNISAPPILQVTFATTNNACSSYNNGSATANPTGGTSPYTYNWSNISSAQTDLSLGAGTYIVTVTDSRNCTVTGSTSITTAAPLVHSAVQTNVLCKGDATGSITLNTSGGNGPYTYAWSSDSLGNVNASLTGPSISSLLAGVYLVTATDGNGCTYRDSFNILEPLLAFTATSAHTDVTCFGANDGTVTITANGGTGAYTYTWNPNVSTTNSATGLSANTYLVTAADANSCSASFSETVTAPGPQSLALADSSNTCFGQSNGYAAATFVNATGTVNYVWSNTQQTQIINNLAAGTYIVTATDANSCVLVDSVTITQPAALTMPVAVTDATCFGANGSVTANPVGGVQPFTYAWSGTSATTQTVALPFGSYTVTASDATQCGQTAAFSIAQPTAIDVQVAQTNILCNGAATGSITLTVSGGTGTYTYTWAPNVSSTNTATGLTAGPYNIQVMDAANCTVDTIVTLTQPAALTATALPTAVLCFGQSNGSIDITASGGTSPYSYTITDGTNPLTNTTGQFSGLAANTYAITVTDQNQCTYSTSATVTQPLQFTDVIARVNPTCYKYTNGQVVVVATGGTPTYNYSFSNGTVNTTGTLNNLAAGTYTVTVIVLNNCTISDTTTLTQPDSVIINVTPTPVEVKLGVPLQLNTTTNQAGNVTYNWSPDFGLSCYNCPDPVFNGVYSQTYKVTTTTQDGCVGSTEFVVTVIPNYDIFIPNVFTPNNDGNNDFWQMFGNLTAVKQVDVAVYNRIGEKVFESNDINFKWDGTYKGTPAPEGVYVYTGKFVWLNNHSDNGFKGTITLLR
ncbi:MAG: hypothetical protein JWO06_1564, partial [Bacteroidota bacterium]|nr:hypothetical protein [Bacteroidota bacterium]